MTSLLPIDPADPFLSIVHHAVDGVLLSRPDGTILRANAAACRLLDRSEEEICRLGRRELVVDTADLHRLERHRLRAPIVTGECLFRRPDGTTFAAEFTSGIFGADQHGPLAYVIFRDATERKATAAALARANRALRLLAAIRAVVVRARTEQELLDGVCREVVTQGGYLLAWVGRPLHDARRTVKPIAWAGREDGYLAAADIVWADAPGGRGPIGTAARSGELVVRQALGEASDEERWRTAALARGYRAATALPIRQTAGTGVDAVLAMYAGEPEPFDDEELGILRQVAEAVSFGLESLHDRTARAHAEELFATASRALTDAQAGLELTQAEQERLATAIEHAAESVIVTDRDGAITYVNPAFEKVTGYSRGEVVGRNPRLLQSGLQDPDFYDELWRTLQAGRVWRGRLVDRRKDGRLITEESTISPVPGRDGVTAGFVAVQHDLTEYLALEATLVHSQKMEDLGRLAGGVAHDFNNLLTVIFASTGLCLDRLPAGSPLREELEEVTAMATRASTLTRQLLAFSRQQTLRPVRLDLNRVLGEMDRMLRRIIGEDVRLELDLAAALPAVEADPGQLEQVVMNLAVNARDAMPHGGTLRIATSPLLLDEAGAARDPGLSAGPHAALVVQDSGCGMDGMTLARIFEPFFTTKAPGQGTGLGLSTVYGVVRQSRGAIQVESAPGRGTTFRILLPAALHAAATSTLAIEAAAPRGDETVLLVEDDQTVRDVVQRVLSGQGYRVLVAANAGEALLHFEQQGAAIDLLLTDVVMPLLGGIELAERLRRQRPAMRALLMTGYLRPLSDSTKRAIDPRQILHKPFAPAELLQRVREALDVAPTLAG